jgi:alkylation response protein AidB-like acyl-CoA dehydrogenase
MHVLLSEEEVLLAASIYEQAIDLGAKSVQALQEYSDDRLWSSLAASDVLGLGLPEVFGGFGMLTDASIVTMALGRALAPVPYLGCAILPTQLLAMSGTGSRLAVEIVSGARRIAVGIDPATYGVASELSAEALAWDCAGADAALVLDGDGSGRLVAVWLEAASAGLDLTRQVRRCVLGKRAPIDSLDGEDGGLDQAALTRWEALALAMVSADMTGVMEGALALAVDHATTRHQFGKPIGSFQSLQHLLAEQHVSVEGARATTLFAAWALDKRPDQAGMAAHVAKAYGSEHGKSLCEAVLQVHGGMGVTWECLAHVFLKRLLFDRALLGDERRHLRAIATTQRAEYGEGDPRGL